MRKGDSVLHLPTQTYFVVNKRTKNRATGEVMLHGGETPYSMAECIPDERGSALSEAELATLMLMVELMIESGEFELDLLSAVSRSQKGQLWAALTVEQREALKVAGRRVEVAA